RQPGAERAHQLALVRRVTAGVRARRGDRRVASGTRDDLATPAACRSRGLRGDGDPQRGRRRSALMNLRAFLLAGGVATVCACNAAPGRPTADSEVPAPSKIVSFDTLYADNCAGCHGANGAGGLALKLADPVYLAIADDVTIRRVVTDGVPGTAMPAFAQSRGGMLTAEQVDAIVRGMRANWAKPDELAGSQAPPHTASLPGDAKRGSEVYARFCASCHGPDGRGGAKASSIVERSYLA